jgi:heme exporter protein B
MKADVSAIAPTEPGLIDGLLAIIRRDLLLAWKRPGDALNPLVFYAMVCTLFPLATGPSEPQLLLNGPGVLWVAALLATLLALNGLFQSDYEDGSLDQLILSPQPLPLLAFGKALAHWLITGGPLVLMSPLLAMTFRLPASVMGLLVLTLALGTLSLSMLGSIGAALTVGLNRGNALLSLLILPLAMPVLIFGARTVSLAVTGESTVAGVYFLAAYCMLALALSPFATAAALKISNE